jgi:glyoxylase-like metal-dependent hydrolase (beta-lactamase superfamily II)
MDDLYFRQLLVGPMANFVYLIGSTATKEAVVVDPAWGIKEIMDVAAADGMAVTGALVTHTHFDHVGGTFHGQRIPGVAEFLELAKAKVYVHKAELERLPVPASEASPTDGQSTLTLGDVTIEFIHTPGHTPGSQCFRVRDRVVSGDTLFIGSCGRTDLPGSDPGAMYESLTQKLAKLDEHTLVFPGHNYAEHATHSSIALEKARNPMLRFPSKSAFLEAMGYGE